MSRIVSIMVFNSGYESEAIKYVSSGVDVAN